MKKLFLLIGTALLVAGCGGGGGGGSAVGSFFASVLGTGGDPVTTTSAAISNPEPSTLALLGIGVAGLAAKALKKKKQ